jgi:predicted DsbA family dithiol-disulfide isomerase
MNAECAGEQGQFWGMHDLLFAQRQLDDLALVALPGPLSLDRRKFDECLRDEAVAARVRASAEQADRLGIRNTPVFLIGRRLNTHRVNVSHVLAGAKPLDVFIQTLDAVIAGSTDSKLWDWR